MPAEEELQVSTLELFSDLVFVFTLTQLTTLLAGDLTAATMARVVLIFDVLFWMYAAYAWLTNMAPPDRPARRLPLMALGESVVAIGIGLGHARLDLGLVAAAVLGLALAAGLWWTYSAGDEQGAKRALSAAAGDRRIRLANYAYFYAYIPMLLGVIVIAAGVKLSIGHVAEPLAARPALALASGVTIYLAGDVAFRRVLGIRPVGYRVAAAAAALTTLPLGILVGAGVQLVGLVTVLVATMAAEARQPRLAAPAEQPR